MTKKGWYVVDGVYTVYETLNFPFFSSSFLMKLSIPISQDGVQQIQACDQACRGVGSNPGAKNPENLNLSAILN